MLLARQSGTSSSTELHLRGTEGCGRQFQSSKRQNLFGDQRQNPQRSLKGIICQSRRYPNMQSPLDTTLAWGDIITLAATEISSERVPLNQTGLLCVVLVLAWVGAATAKGDYSFRYATSSSNLVFGQQQINMLKATFSACLTWVMFTPVAVACYASLVTHKFIPTTVFASRHGEIPPQLEVLVATLFTVSSWRGIYAYIRPFM